MAPAVREWDAIVVGAGVMGSAAAWWLGRAGRSVLLLERHEVGHARGSSHGASRVFRFSYRDPEYVQMAMDARQLWRQAEAEADTTLLLTLGGIDFGEGAEQNQRALATCGASYELVDGAEAMRRYPRITVPPAAPALLPPDYGVILAERSVRTFVDLAVARGAELREGAGVSDLSVGDRDASVVAAGERHRSAVVVLAAGPWTGPLAAEAGIDVPVTPSRESVSYSPGADGEPGRAGRRRPGNRRGRARLGPSPLPGSRPRPMAGRDVPVHEHR